MDGFQVNLDQDLRSPIVLLAFSGWSDTGTVTVDLASHLIDTYAGRRFLSVDPEDYYVFTETRPEVKLDSSGLREIHWPKNEGFACYIPEATQDLVLIRGVEPNTNWKRFSAQLSTVIAEIKPKLVCTLVARPAAMPHTRPIVVSGSSADEEIARVYGLESSRYQGPTGLIGVAHDAMRKHDLPLISLAASIPHYLSVEENPPATIALIKALEPILGFSPPTTSLEEESVRFLERVEEASKQDSQIGSYVKTLEERYAEMHIFDESTATETEAAANLSADDILRDVEDLLRHREDEDQ